MGDKYGATYRKEKKGSPVRRYTLLPLALCLTLLLTACGPRTPAAGTDPPSPGPAGPVETEPVEPTPEVTLELTPEPTPEPTPEITPEPAHTQGTFYQFGTPVAESAPAADDSFFADAAFVGDSRTDGLHLYGGIRQGDYLCKTSMSVFHLNDSKYSVTLNGREVTVMQALQAKRYGKVYIMLGLNELGYPASSYETQLSAFLDQVIAAQPDAVVYLELMPPVNDTMTAQDWQKNANVDVFNEINARLAADKRVALLNVAEVYRDAGGQLKQEYASSDGCHFQAEAYSYWADYLRNHVIDRDWYFASREGAQ